jgi:hypothetical protein
MLAMIGERFVAHQEQLVLSSLHAGYGYALGGGVASVERDASEAHKRALWLTERDFSQK